jgi:hypothetical protein
MLAGIFALGFWPLAFFVLCIAGLFWGTIAESAVGLAIVIAIAVAAATFSGYDPLGYLFQSPSLFFSGVVLYLLLGLGWAGWKWRRYLKKPEIFKQISQAKQDFFDQSPSLSIDDFMDSELYPDVAWLSNNKDRIISWWMMWPLSAFWYVLGDMLVEAFNWLYGKAAGLFRSISRSTIS